MEFDKEDYKKSKLKTKSNGDIAVKLSNTGSREKFDQDEACSIAAKLSKMGSRGAVGPEEEVMSVAYVDEDLKSDSDMYCVCEDDDESTKWVKPGRYGLAGRTSKWISILITVCILVAHAGLAYGQAALIWDLFIIGEVNISAAPAGPFAVAAWGLLGLANPEVVNESVSLQVKNFTYGASVESLWLNANPWTKAGAVLLVLFSGVWPHFKLFMLHLMYYCPISGRFRRPILYWLSSLGKLSLADICLTCLLFSVVALSVDYEVSQYFPSGTSIPPDGKYPGGNLMDIKLQGGIDGELKVRAFVGFAFFTAGVVISCFCSMVVDFIENSNTSRDRGVSGLRDALKQKGINWSQKGRLMFHGCNHLGHKICLSFLILAMPVLLLSGLMVPIIDWEIAGVLPKLVLYFSPQSTSKTFSVLQLMIDSGLGATAYNSFSVAFLAVMVFLLPLLRALIIVCLAIFPLPVHLQYRFASFSNVTGAFIALEPLILCLVLLQLNITEVTETIISDGDCNNLKNNEILKFVIGLMGINDTDCVVINVRLLPEFSILISGWLLLIGLNYLAWRNAILYTGIYGG